MQTILHRSFSKVKALLPQPVSNLVRNTVTAFLTPIMFSHHSGHFKSSFSMKALDKSGKAVPWYTFPCIDLLTRRDFKTKQVLEFGGGQSSIWWGGQASHVVSFEGNKAWFDYIKKQMPGNVELYHVRDENATVCVQDVETILAEKGHNQFDIIVIDGLWRYELIPLCLGLLSADGVIICDNSEGYQFREGFDKSGMQRVDFYGYASGAIMRTCTSLFFHTSSFVFSNSNRLETNGFN